MSLWNFTLLTSFLKPIQRFASTFVWMFIGWTPIRPKIIHSCFREFPGDIVVSLLKFGCDLYFLL